MGIYRHLAVPRAQLRCWAPNAVSNAEISLANVSYLCLATISFRPRPWILSYTYNYNQSVGKAFPFYLFFLLSPAPSANVDRGGSRIFLMGVADTNRPPNVTLICLKLSYVCPKTWRRRKDELETVRDLTEISRGGGGGNRGGGHNFLRLQKREGSWKMGR